MNIEKKYPGQPNNEIWFYDKDRPYYWLTNFYYNEKSIKEGKIIGRPQYSILARLPLQHKKQTERMLPFDENGKIHEKEVRYYIGFSKESFTSKKVDFIIPTHWGNNVFFRKTGPIDETINGAGNLSYEHSTDIEWGTAEQLFQALKFTAWENNPELLGIDRDEYGINLEAIRKAGGAGVSLVDLYVKACAESIGKSIHRRSFSESEIRELKPNLYLEAIRRILADPDPRAACDFANRTDKDFIRRKDWHGKMKLRAMKWVVREKFKIPELKEKLWKTGNKKLVEHTKNDNFWGDGGDGSGQNKLGEILMEIRQEIINEKGKIYDGPVEESEIPEPVSPEPDTTKPASPETPKSGEKSGSTNKEGSKPVDKNSSEKDKPKNNSNNSQLQEVQDKVIADITTALNQDPKITDSELDYYQNWREILKKFTDLDKIEVFKSDLILVIQSKRKDKQTAYELRDKIQGAQQKTGESLREDLRKLKKSEGEKVYEEQREKVEELAQKSAQEDPESYQKMAVNLIRESLEINAIKETELENDKEIKTDWEKLKKGEISQPEAIIATEKKITGKVGEIGAQKRFNKLVEKVNQALKSGEREQLKKAATEIAKFISSSNVYNQSLYSKREKIIKELQAKLENYSTNHTLPNPSTKFPWEIVVPVSLLVILAVVATVVIVKKKRLRKKC